MKMTHKYKISGMTCNHCVGQVQKTLEAVAMVENVIVDLENGLAVVSMSEHIDLETFKKAFEGSSYMIHNINDAINTAQKKKETTEKPKKKGVFYCSMHCEGDKTYDESGSCPICGMDLIEEVSLATASTVEYTCSMHPEVIKSEPGACPICGMDLIPLEPSESEEEKTYSNLLKKMKISLVFTVPIFLIAMADLIPGNPLAKLFDLYTWNWIQLVMSFPVVFYACWMFFERAWKSIVTMNLNMFTLIGIGTGVAWVFSIVAMFFPDVFPNQFKTEAGTVFVYFEATTVILTLVLLGQLLEAKAHSQTSGAIKELLKLAPTEATLVTDGGDKVISIHDIVKGNLLRVKPGDKIPVDVAIESSEVTLVKGDLMGIVKAVNLGHKVMKNINQNLFFAFVYNMLGVPVAAGLLFPIFEIFLSPMIAAAAMSFSSVSVIANALRLRTQNIN